MIPVLDLPVRPPEAAALADVIFENAEGKRLTAAIRNRIAALAATLKTPGIEAHFGSLQTDPVHPSAYFLAVDAMVNEPPRPLLLRFAPSTSPASGLLKDALLVGRMRLANRSEIVVNAFEFGPSNGDAIRTFATQIDRAFLPKPAGVGATISAPSQFADAAFADFRQILKTRGQNMASLHGAAEPAMWSAIRAGWREGYELNSGAIEIDSGNREAAAQAIHDSLDCTRIVLDPSRAPAANRAALALDFLALAHKSRAGGARGRQFDFGLALAASGEATESAALLELLGVLREAGRAPQSVAPLFGESVDETIAAIRQAGAAVGIGLALLNGEVSRAAAGRLQVAIADATPVRDVAERLRG